MFILKKKYDKEVKSLESDIAKLESDIYNLKLKNSSQETELEAINSNEYHPTIECTGCSNLIFPDCSIYRRHIHHYFCKLNNKCKGMGKIKNE